MENFGDRLRKLRGERSQREIASELGIPITTLSTLENQETVPRGEVLEKIAAYFRVPITCFFRPVSFELKASDAAHAWLRELREPATGKETIATSANIHLDEKIKEKIAKRIKDHHAKVSARK